MRHNESLYQISRKENSRSGTCFQNLKRQTEGCKRGLQNANLTWRGEKKTQRRSQEGGRKTIVRGGEKPGEGRNL